LIAAFAILPAAATASDTDPFGVKFDSAPAKAPTTTRDLLRTLDDARPGSDAVPGLVAELARRYPRLDGEARREADTWLARPTDGAADPNDNGYSVPEALGSPQCAGQFCVHWVGTTADAPSPADADFDGVPDYVETVLATAEQSFQIENGQLGWRAPKTDVTRGGGGETDIYLAQLGGSGIYGYAAPDPGQLGGNSLAGYLVLDNDYAPAEYRNYASPLMPLQATMAHEYNHILQFGYDALADTWMFESSAVWMEEKVFPALNDYLQYLRGWSQLTAQPMTLFNSAGQGIQQSNVKVYGSAVWNFWLSNRYENNVVRSAWERSPAQRSFAPAAYDSAIKAAGGDGFSPEFAEFAAATAEWTSGNGFPEGRLYPDVQRAGQLRVNGRGGTATLDHTGYALINVSGVKGNRLKLAGRAPEGTAAAIALVARSGNRVVTRVAHLPEGGLGSVTLTRPRSYQRLTAVLVNADVAQTGFNQQTGDWTWTREDQEINVVASTDFKRPKLASVRTDGSVAEVRFSEPVLGVNTKTVQLVGPGGKRVAAAVIFTDGQRVAGIVPKRGLKAGTRYTIRVADGIFDTSLNPLARTKTLSFTTPG
jgi:hypothetical protein